MAIIGYNHFRWFYHKQLFSTNLQRTGKKKKKKKLVNYVLEIILLCND